MTRALVSGLDVAAHRDAFDLDLRSAEQSGADRGPRRLVGSEPLPIDLIHCLEVGEVRQEDGRLRYAVERGVGRDEDRGEVVEHAPCLCSHVIAADELAALGIQRELPRTEHEVAREDRLAIRADGRGRAVRFGDAAIIRQTGSSFSAVPSRYVSRVARSAAMVSLSGRSARMSGCVRSAVMDSARPTAIPACGPPSSLSPLKVTTSAPSRIASPTVSSLPRPNRDVSRKVPLPRSWMKATLCSRASAASSRPSARATNPLILKLLACTRRIAPVFAPIAPA